MSHDKDQEPSRSVMIGFRVSTEQKALVVQAAEREGLQISSFIIMILVRLHILPESCLSKIKRRPVPFFSALHGVLGIVNKIGGNCKQLAAAMPDTDGLHETHICLIHAAAAITDVLRGQSLPAGVNLYRLQGDITKAGVQFNQLVKSVNIGRPNLADLPVVLGYVRECADAIAAALTGHPVLNESAYEAIMEKALDEMRENMKKAAAQHVQRDEDA